MAWPAKNAPKEETSPTTAVTAVSTTALAASRVRRWGTAARLDRIEPVEYSLVMTSTPSTPTASWARKKPLRLYDAGFKIAWSGGLRRSKRAVKRTPRPTIAIAATTMVQ